MNGNIRLTDQEQRLLEMMRRTSIDAELAVQLGVPVGDVKDRIERLKAKLGVESRAELAAWSPDGAKAHEPSPVVAIPVSDNEPLPADPSSRGMSRRRVLALGGVGLVVVAGGVGAAVALRGGGGNKGTDDETPGPTASGQSPEPSAAASAVPTLPPSDALSRLATMRETTGQWATREFARGEAIPWHAGIFFMNVDSGGVTGYQVAKPRGSDDVEPQGYTTDELNSVIVARGRDVGYVYNRKLRQSWEFSLKGVVVKGLSERYLLLGTGTTNEVRYDSTEPLTFALVPTDGTPPIAIAELADVGWNNVQDAFIDDEAGVAWLWRLQGQNSELYLLKNNQLAPMANYPIEAGYSPRPRWLSKDAAVIECNSQDPDLKPYSMVIRISETSLRRVIDQVPGSNADLSPDGQYVAYTETEAGDWRGQSIANESRGVFRNVVIKRIGTGSPVLRVRSADLGFGDALVGTRWLADSSGIVVMVRGGDDESPHQRRRVAVANIDGSPLKYVPIPPAANERWYGQRLFRGALPAPGGRRDLFSVGHYELLNTTTGQFTTMDIGEEGPTHLPPWDRDGREMRFALPHGGHDGSSPAVMLEPRIEQYPFPSGMRMRVKGAGDCLNLRAFPSTTAEVRGCYPDGTLVEVSPQPSSPRVPDLAECLFTGEGEWVAVKTEDGKLGWASADYLEWA